MCFATLFIFFATEKYEIACDTCDTLSVDE